jgi:hypothetical protein
MFEKTISKIPFFSKKSVKKVLHLLGPNMQSIKFAAGEIIVKADDFASEMYFI